MAAVQAGARLDRLPIGPFHRRMLWLVAMGMFFDSFDNTLSSSVLAAMLSSHWSTIGQNSVFMSVTFAGLTVGAALAGWMSDRFGRRFAYQFNLAIFGTMALASACAPSMAWLIPIRAVMGVGMGAEYVMGYGLITEFVPPGQRGRYLGLLGLIAGTGLFATSLLSVAVIPWIGWRAMFVIGGVGTLWVWWERRKLPESPRWLERVGRTAEAEAVLRAIEREAAPDGPPPPLAERPAPEPRQVPISILFSPPVRRRTLLAMFINVTALFGSYSLTGWMPTFFVRQGMSVTHSLGFSSAMMAGYMAGPLLCAHLADRVGRRGGLVLSGLLCAGLAAVYAVQTAPVPIVACGVLLIAAVAAFLTLGLGGTPELFATEYRFRGGAVAQTAGRAALIASPFVILAIFDRWGIGGVVGLVSGFYLVAAVLMAFTGIEANQRSLEALEPDPAVPPARAPVSAASRRP